MRLYVLFFFFFKQKTAYEVRISDWSSDVCSSDLPPVPAGGEVLRCTHAGQRSRAARPGPDVGRDEPGGRDEARDPCAVPCTHRNLLIRVVPRDRAARSRCATGHHANARRALWRCAASVWRTTRPAGQGAVSGGGGDPWRLLAREVRGPAQPRARCQ